MEMITPPQLKEGDSIYILSTARKISLEELQPAIEELKSWGLKVIIGDSIEAEANQYAGNEELRVNDFNKAIRDKNVKAILCGRGGYGSVRIVDDIDWNHLTENPKWIAGYSDVTTIHSHANNMEIKTIHSTMPINYSTNSKASWTTLKSALFGESIDVLAYPHKVHRSGTFKGQIIGGNLSIIYSLLGSPSSLNTAGKILFIEDLDEYLYHIDRMMMNIKRNGYFDQLSGLIIGGMTDMNDNTIPFGKNALDIIFEHVAEFDFPVIYNFPVGHVDDNRAIILGDTI
jgi:muramoyltetrapeptide carboxypeptidase